MSPPVASADEPQAHRFRFQVPDQAIDDLHARLAATRWPTTGHFGEGYEGMPLEQTKALVAYWRDGFDWRRFEDRLNRWDNSLIEIDGLRTHFLHCPSPHRDALPLVLTHGWPGSIAEFLEVIPRLIEPERFGGRPQDAWSVVVPALPGHALSEAAGGPHEAARRQIKLLRALGYDRYVAQGGDWGSLVSRHMAADDPEHCIGLHLNLMPPVASRSAPGGVAEGEQAWLDKAAAHDASGTGYFLQQSTRPLTLAYGLGDSPAGWCAWAAEKFLTWSDPSSHGGAIDRDTILGQVSLYWFTDTIASSLRFYRAYAEARARGEESPGRAAAPVGFTAYPGEFYKSPRAWMEARYRIVHWREAPAGGHFAALEQPAFFAEDLWAFRQRLREEGV